jgi:hypothetical protein
MMRLVSLRVGRSRLFLLESTSVCAMAPRLLPYHGSTTSTSRSKNYNNHRYYTTATTTDTTSLQQQSPFLFDCVLIANRGEIARRIARTCCDLNVPSAVVYTSTDAQSSFVHEADDAVPVTSYLNTSEIIHAAKRIGATAIHPGCKYYECVY